MSDLHYDELKRELPEIDLNCRDKLPDVKKRK